MTINKDSWINQVLTLCGGRNIFAQASVIAPVVNMEAVVMANPDVILGSDENHNWKKKWQRWSNMTAVKNDALFTMTPDFIHRAGPRLLKGIEEVCEAFQMAKKADK